MSQFVLPHDEETIEAVWQLGRVVPGRSPVEWRKDECGAWMLRNQYGNSESEFGWTVRSVAPGQDSLRPFHLQNSYHITNGRAHCQVAADREGIAAGQRIGQPRNRQIRGARTGSQRQ